MQHRLVDCFDLTQIFLRKGFLGLCSNLVFLLLALAILIIIIRKPKNGDMLGFGFVYAQFYSCMFWIINGIIMSYCRLSYTLIPEEPTLSLQSYWVLDQSFLVIGCIYQAAFMAVLFIGLMIRYKSKAILSIWNVAGISAAIISVSLNMVTRNYIHLFPLH